MPGSAGAPASNVELLLQAQRGRMRSVLPMQKKAYESAYKKLVEVAERYGLTDAPRLLVVSSMHALTEMIEVDSEKWIVYDQYLGQIFSRISALIRQDAPTKSIDIYLKKLYAGRLLVNGRTREAFLVALSHAVERAGDSFKADFDPVRHEQIHFQEVFVLAHELMHSALASNPVLRDLLQHTYLNFCMAEASDKHDRPRPTVEMIAESLADDFNRDYVRTHGEVDEAVLAAGKEKFVERAVTVLQSQDFLTSEQILHEPVLAEEVICDAYAAILTAHVLGDGTSKSALAVLTAAFDANQKLRLIKHMDGHINGHPLQRVILRDTTARGSQLRQVYRALYESGMTKIALGFESTTADYLTMLEHISSTNQQFYDRVFDRLIFGSFYSDFDKSLDHDAMRAVAPDLPSLGRCWETVADLMGFSSKGSSA